MTAPVDERVRYRCPICKVIFPGREYVCRGRWPIYDPDDVDALDAPHPPAELEEIPRAEWRGWL